MALLIAHTFGGKCHCHCRSCKWLQAGDHHVVLLAASGSVWALGSSNETGQVGSLEYEQPASSTQQPPQQQQQDEDSQQEMGAARPGQASPLPTAAGGSGRQADQMSRPVLVLGPGSISCCEDEIRQVAAGACHSAAISAGSGRLYTWGWAAHGQCGTGSTSDVLQPRLCSALDGVPLACVAAGMAHTAVVSRDGSVYCCGRGSHGELGVAAPGTGLGGGSPREGAGGGRAAAGGVSCRQQQQQQQAEGLSSSLLPVLVEQPEMDHDEVVKVVCGSRHTVVLTRSGAVFAWGWNKYHQCCCCCCPIANGSELNPGRAGLINSSRCSVGDVVPLPQRVKLPPAAAVPGLLQALAGGRGVSVASQCHQPQPKAAPCVSILRAVDVYAGWWLTAIAVAGEP